MLAVTGVCPLGGRLPSFSLYSRLRVEKPENLFQPQIFFERGHVDKHPKNPLA